MSTGRARVAEGGRGSPEDLGVRPVIAVLPSARPRRPLAAALLERPDAGRVTP